MAHLGTMHPTQVRALSTSFLPPSMPSGRCARVSGKRCDKLFIPKQYTRWTSIQKLAELNEGKRHFIRIGQVSPGFVETEASSLKD